MVETVAVAALRACPEWVARTSPQKATRPRIVNVILGFVMFMIFVGIILLEITGLARASAHGVMSQ